MKMRLLLIWDGIDHISYQIYAKSMQKSMQNLVPRLDWTLLNNDYGLSPVESFPIWIAVWSCSLISLVLSFTTRQWNRSASATSHLIQGWTFPKGVQYPSGPAWFLRVWPGRVGSLGGGCFWFFLTLSVGDFQLSDNCSIVVSGLIP